MKNEELKKYHDIYNDSWKLFKKYAEPVDTSDFWEALAQEASTLLKQHGNTEFARKMFGLALEEIERLSEVKEGAKC